MEKREIRETRDSVKTALALEDSILDTILQALNFENREEFTPEQFSLIEKYDYLRQNNLLDYLEAKIAENENSLERALHAVYAECEVTESSGARYTLKSLMEEIAKKIERPVKLSEMEEILELAGLGVEEEYTEEDRKALDGALPRYLARELSRKEAGSSDAEIGAVIDRSLSGEAEELTDTIAGTVASAREGLEETFQREIPRQMLAQVVALARSGVLDRKIEAARREIAERKRIEGGTTIDVSIGGEGEKKQLKSADAGDGTDGE